jgi:hypothetical protein
MTLPSPGGVRWWRRRRVHAGYFLERDPSSGDRRNAFTVTIRLSPPMEFGRLPWPCRGLRGRGLPNKRPGHSYQPREAQTRREHHRRRPDPCWPPLATTSIPWSTNSSSVGPTPMCSPPLSAQAPWPETAGREFLCHHTGDGRGEDDGLPGWLQQQVRGVRDLPPSLNVVTGYRLRPGVPLQPAASPCADNRHYVR